MKVEFLAPAERELREGIGYYAAYDTLLGQEFVLEVERVCALLRDLHALGPRCDSRHRRMLLRRVPYAIIYRADVGVVRIVALAHKRRGPAYWATAYVRDVMATYRLQLAA